MKCGCYTFTPFTNNYFGIIMRVPDEGYLNRFPLSCFGLLIYLLSKTFRINWLSDILALRVLDGGYSRNSSFTLYFIYMFIFLI